MTNKLFIIGNGFDLHHGIPSRYSQFGEYLNTVDRSIYNMVERYLSFSEDFWNYFEARLANFDSDHVMDYASNFLPSYGADDWSDSGHHDYEYEIQQIVEGLSWKLRNHFASWVRSLPIPESEDISLIQCVDRNALFLNFNYTPTLQQIYGIPEKNVLHIHGDARNLDAELVLGHGWEPQDRDRLSNGVDEDTDTRVAGGYDLIDSYFSDTFKPTSQIIDRNQLFFSRLNNVSEIFVLGHSLEDVDYPYFEEVARHVDPAAHWVVSYYNDRDDIERKFWKPDNHTVEFAETKTL